MLEEAKERLGGKQIVEAAVIDADNPEKGDGIAEQVKQLFGISTVYRTQISPVIGTHAGPGTVGFAFYTE
jgi:fatty acid-binding protein DegV